MGFHEGGPPFRCEDFYGKTISYQGIDFEGSPRHVFWGRYIEPFLEDLVARTVNETLRLAADKRQDAKAALREASGLLKSVARRAYSRMAEIDRLLLADGYPEKMPLREIENEVKGMEGFIDRRVSAEVAMIKSKFRINELYTEHPFFFWAFGTFVAIVLAFVAG